MHGILLVDKPEGKSSFALVQAARRLFNERCIGHAGTLDPLATGLVILLVGRSYTRLSDRFLSEDKVYEGRIRLGSSTTTYDKEGPVTQSSPSVPTFSEIETALSSFQGETLQEPPMFSAKKINGQKLYELARKGVTIERQKSLVKMTITLLSYNYPFLDLHISCSKGTYIRSLAHDLGITLGCYAHLESLRRLKSGGFSVDNALVGSQLLDGSLSSTSFSINHQGLIEIF